MSLCPRCWPHIYSPGPCSEVLLWVGWQKFLVNLSTGKRETELPQDYLGLPDPKECIFRKDLCISLLTADIRTNAATSHNTHIYHLTVSVGQKNRYGLAVSSAQDLTKLQSRSWLGCIIIRRLNWGQIHFQAHSGCSQIHFLVAVWPRAPAFCWLWTRSCP